MPKVFNTVAIHISLALPMCGMCCQEPNTCASNLVFFQVYITTSWRSSCFGWICTLPTKLAITAISLAVPKLPRDGGPPSPLTHTIYLFTHLLVFHVVNQLVCSSAQGVQCGAWHITTPTRQGLLHNTVTLSTPAKSQSSIQHLNGSRQTSRHLYGHRVGASPAAHAVLALEKAVAAAAKC